MKSKWWSVKEDGRQCAPNYKTSKVMGALNLGLANVGGIFVVLFFGSILALVICVFELFWKIGRIPTTERDNLFLEVIREPRNVFWRYGNTRPVRRKTSADIEMEQRG